MLGSSYDYARGSCPSDFHNVASTTFLSNRSNPAMIASVRHAFLDGGVDHDPDSLTETVGDE
jgi:hypothetical protein